MDLAQMIIYFATPFAASMWRFLWVLGALVGFIYGGTALMRMQRASRFPGQVPVTVGDILPILIIGALLMNLSRFINSAWNSIGIGTVTYGPISYAAAGGLGRLSEAVNAVLTLASVAGGVYFFRGLLFLKKASVDGQSSQGADDSVWRGITHMMGGVALVQIAQMIDAFRQSFDLFW